MNSAYLWIAVYLILALLPAVWWRPTAPGAYIYDAARLFGLIGFSMILLQPILAARWKWIERQVGLDRLMHWHRLTGMATTFLVIGHLTAFLLYYGQFGTDLALALITPGFKFETVGLAAFVLLLVTVIFALTRKSLHMPYHWWKRLHMVGYVIVLLVFIHAWFLGSDVRSQPLLRYYLVGLFGCVVYVAVYRYIIRPIVLRRHPYSIKNISEIVPGVRHITFTGGPNQPLQYQPGQCIFVQFRSAGITREWHPFTLSSSPTDPELTLSIKASGDWTNTLGQLKVGDQALLDGPFGRFSYTRVAPRKPLVYIAGGIGVTPLRSMMRHCLNTAPERSQYLLYANKTEQDIAFRDEFEHASQQHPTYKVVNVLSRDQQWSGEKGYVTADLIKKYLAAPTDHEYFICGPKPMMRAVKAELRKLGVLRQHMHSEEFALV